MSVVSCQLSGISRVSRSILRLLAAILSPARSPIENQKSKIKNQTGFTLIEVLVSLIIVVLSSTMVLMTFSSVTTAWRRGTRITEDLHHGDFVMDQMVLGLRSAYYPEDRQHPADYGFRLDNEGSGESAHDRISWVKRGSAFASTDNATVAGPHRIQFSIEDNEDGVLAPAVRMWRPYALPEDFDPENIAPVFVSSRIRGFDCRVTTNKTDDGWEWEDTWEDESTNQLPHAVELTLYLTPLAEDEPLVEMRRVVDIPVAHLSWGRTSLRSRGRTSR